MHFFHCDRILPIAENENGLATVLGHEIAHQLARHSAEKLSFTKVALFLGLMFSVIFDPSYSVQRIVMDLGMMVHASLSFLVTLFNDLRKIRRYTR